MTEYGNDKRLDDAKEEISALMDDAFEEGSQEDLLSSLKNNAELQATWQRFHLIRDVLQRKNEPILASLGKTLVERVREAIAKEPPVVWAADFNEKPIISAAEILSENERNISNQ